MNFGTVKCISCSYLYAYRLKFIFVNIWQLNLSIGEKFNESDLVMLMESKDKQIQKAEKNKLDKRDVLLKAMNLTPLKPHGKFRPLFKKNLKDPSQIMDKSALKDIDFEYDDPNKRRKIGRKISSSEIRAAAINLFIHKVENTDQKIKYRK
jgi:hypothetical protein